VRDGGSTLPIELPEVMVGYSPPREDVVPCAISPIVGARP
jgi:hypothetical protein